MANTQGDEAGQLSASQQDALQQYVAVTNQEPKEAIPLLERSQWNVQIAIAKFFDGEGPDLLAEAIEEHNAPRVAARHENLQESLLASEFTSRARPARDRTDPAPRIVPQQQITARTPFLLGLLLTPFSWGWTAVSTLFRTILYTLTFLPAAVRPRLATSLTSTTGRRMLMPRDAAARFKREFDEEYGQNDLEFFEGGIAQAHDLAKKELKFLMVVLLSQEHDDTQSFVRDTLLAPDTVAFLKENEKNMIIWGGSVVDSEAYQVATEYSCTKFPFTALVCLTPKEGSTRMGIVKRLTGPMPATTYLSELQAAMEKYGADMASVRAERTAREVTRSLRDQQDSAYERSLAKDKERAREKREAAAAAAEAERRAVQAAKDAARLEEMRHQWKQWRASQIRPEPAAGEGSVVRVAVKMPESLGAERIVRRFAAEAPMEELYAFVECYDLLREGGADELPQGSKKPDGYEHKYMFRISSTLPRRVYESSETETMGDKIGKSSNLIVEEILADDSDDDESA